MSAYDWVQAIVVGAAVLGAAAAVLRRWWPAPGRTAGPSGGACGSAPCAACRGCVIGQVAARQGDR